MNLFGSRPKQDPKVAADIAAREKATAAREKQLKQEADAKAKALKGKNAGRRSLLSGLETGVVGGEVDKIGG